MNQLNPHIAEIDRMPRGGPDASWLDRRLQTDVLEYTDRYDVPDEIKQHIITALDRMGTRLGLHETCARLALDRVAGIDNPKILELGAGHGRLSEQIVRLHPTAEVTITDLDPTSVHNIAIGEVGTNERVSTKVIDATAIDEPDDKYDLVVFAGSFHHLPPSVAHRAVAESTRVGTKFLVFDIKRPHSIVLLLMPIFMLAVVLFIRPLSAARAGMHDGLISGLRSYSPSAFTALGRAADPAMNTEFLAWPGGFPHFPKALAVVYSRP